MIVKTNITLYYCEFCKKELKRKHAMVNHESKCRNNPTNYQPCFNCKYFQEHVDSRNYYSCNKLNKQMYTINAVHKKLLEKYPESFEEQEQMPLLECPSFETNKASEIMDEINSFIFSPFDVVA